eukprot:TRINITY_DN10854_c0_g1_i2.p2 TRINITY_DN10854_c0_g1~~TRINITY_DN10854_c0_g1_i2.p2  ORF type:complete len:245 (+),score=75.84 TRINITY_DN10854_c0_g1_i2:108-737(+)
MPARGSAAARAEQLAQQHKKREVAVVTSEMRDRADLIFGEAQSRALMVAPYVNEGLEIRQRQSRMESLPVEELASRLAVEQDFHEWISIAATRWSRLRTVCLEMAVTLREEGLLRICTREVEAQARQLLWERAEGRELGRAFGGAHSSTAIFAAPPPAAEPWAQWAFGPLMISREAAANCLPAAAGRAPRPTATTTPTPTGRLGPMTRS